MQMPEAMRSGIVFARKGALLPASVRVESDTYVSDWSMITADDPFLLDKTIRTSGWSFFSLAGEITSFAFGRPTAVNFRRAISRALHRVSRHLNSAEITAVAGKHFLGIPYVTATVCSRHIQDHLYLLSVGETASYDQLGA